MMRTLFNTAACVVTLVAVSVTNADASRRAQTSTCNYVCTSDCPDASQKEALCRAIGGSMCLASSGCPDSTDNCPGNIETTCTNI